MSDEPRDRLGDLGAGRHPPPDEEQPPGGEKRSAAERFAELDVTQPEEDDPGRKPTPTPRPSRVYSYLIGLAFLLVVVLAAIATLPNAGEGLRGPEEGEVIPDFAAPSALGSSDAGVNLKRPGDEGANRTPACDVRDRNAINICDIRREKPVVITFIAREGDCEPALDVIERVRDRYPQVAFVGVVSGQEREDVAELVRERGWGFPVAVDADGLLINAYGIGVCPTTTFAYRGGEAKESELGNLGEDELAQNVDELLREQARRR